MIKAAWFRAALRRALGWLVLLAAATVYGVAAVLASDQPPNPWWSLTEWIEWWYRDPNSGFIALTTAAGSVLGLVLSVYQVFFSQQARQARIAILAEIGRLGAVVEAQNERRADQAAASEACRAADHQALLGVMEQVLDLSRMAEADRRAAATLVAAESESRDLPTEAILGAIRADGLRLTGGELRLDRFEGALARAVGDLRQALSELQRREVVVDAEALRAEAERLRRRAGQADRVALGVALGAAVLVLVAFWPAASAGHHRRTLLASIEGRWGQVDCARPYTVTVRNDVITFRRGTYASEGVVMKVDGPTVETKNLTPRGARGTFSRLVYSRDPAREYLQMNHEVSDTGVRLERCS